MMKLNVGLAVTHQKKAKFSMNASTRDSDITGQKISNIFSILGLSQYRKSSDKDHVFAQNIKYLFKYHRIFKLEESTIV